MTGKQKLLALLPDAPYGMYSVDRGSQGCIMQRAAGLGIGSTMEQCSIALGLTVEKGWTIALANDGRDLVHLSEAINSIEEPPETGLSPRTGGRQ